MKVNLEAKKRIAALVKESGSSIEDVAKQIGTSYSTLWNFLNGETRNFGRIQELADVLGKSLYELTSDNYGDNNVRTTAVADLAASRQQSIMSPPALSRVPLYQAHTGDDSYSLSGEAAEYVSRLVAEGVSKVFALRVRGHSMEPRYRWGEIVYCGQNVQPDPGGDCLVELADHQAYLTTYIGEKEGSYIFRQLSPTEERRWPVGVVQALHAVVGRR